MGWRWKSDECTLGHDRKKRLQQFRNRKDMRNETESALSALLGERKTKSKEKAPEVVLGDNCVDIGKGFVVSVNLRLCAVISNCAFASHQ